MALSYYSNWEPFQAQLDSDYLAPLTELPPELLPCPNAWNFDYAFEPNDLFYSETSAAYLDCSTGVTPFDSFTTETRLLQQELEPFHYPKRQKVNEYEDVYSDQFKPGFFSGFVPNHGLTTVQDYSAPDMVVPPLPDLPAAPPGYGCDQSTLKKEPSAGTLSAQSIAARQRRRKITEKTQELGKLVPGGQKMNTAEMLQAAYKYIKYLEAQVGILEFMASYQHQEEKEVLSVDPGELHSLLESTLIQEKIYSTEKCLVPQKFVQELSSDERVVKSNPQLLQLVVKQVKEEH